MLTHKSSPLHNGTMENGLLHNPRAARAFSRLLLGVAAIHVAVLVASFCRAATGAPAPPRNAPLRGDSPARECAPCMEFNRLTIRVRDGEISRTAARNELARLIPAIRSYYYGSGGEEHPVSEWVFPLQGYTAKAIDGGRGHGFEPRGYDYFDGNRHGGHPSFDIFIRDRDQDERDDRTGSHVAVLSLTGGVVVALEPAWEAGSPLRGGKYLWVYDPAGDALVYYAHNRELFVGVGDLVKPGDLLAAVGRTGLNAFRKRSPTHLHITYLKFRSGSPVPEDIYPLLLRSRCVE